MDIKLFVTEFMKANAGADDKVLLNLLKQQLEDKKIEDVDKKEVMKEFDLVMMGKEEKNMQTNHKDDALKAKPMKKGLAESLNIGTSITIPQNLAADPANMRGKSGKIVNVDDTGYEIEFEGGRRARYSKDVFENVEEELEEASPAAEPSENEYMMDTKKIDEGTEKVDEKVVRRKRVGIKHVEDEEEMDEDAKLQRKAELKAELAQARNKGVASEEAKANVEVPAVNAPEMKGSVEEEEVVEAPEEVVEAAPEGKLVDLVNAKLADNELDFLDIQDYNDKIDIELAGKPIVMIDVERKTFSFDDLAGMDDMEIEKLEGALADLDLVDRQVETDEFGSMDYDNLLNKDRHGMEEFESVIKELQTSEVQIEEIQESQVFSKGDIVYDNANKYGYIPTIIKEMNEDVATLIKTDDWSEYVVESKYLDFWNQPNTLDYLIVMEAKKLKNA